MAPTLHEKTCPRCGKTFEARDKRRISCSRSCAASTRMRTGGFGKRSTNSKAHRRPDLENRYFRSTWEANVARWCNYRQASGEIASWEYEPKRFDFPIKRGNNSYLPDFRVFKLDGSYEWLEVKGWMDRNSQVKLKRFAKFYPEEPLVLVDKKVYDKIVQDYGELIPNWES